MPTGYTHGINETTTLKEFAMSCAREMGACIMMRDDPASKPIPERFEPSDYHQKKHEEETAELKQLLALSDTEVAARCQEEYDKDLTRHLQCKEDAKDMVAKYQRVRDLVSEWAPPTTDHQGLRNFMLGQLDQSIEHDGGVYVNLPTVKDPEIWYTETIKKLRESIVYNEKHHLEEITRTESRNRWLRQLRESLK